MRFPTQGLLTLAKITIMLLIIIGCSKQTNDFLQSGEALVSVTLSGSAIDKADEQMGNALNRSSSAFGSATAVPNTRIANTAQTFTVPFDEKIMIFGTLEQIESTADALPANGLKNSVKVNSKAAMERSPLPTNTQYRILVYDSNNIFVTERLYTYTKESTTQALLLDGGKTYTFVGVSVNSTTSAPTVSYANNNNRTLATSSVNNVTGDLMYFKQTLTLNGGNNNLSVILRHVFSQITTNLLIDPSVGGTITGLTTPVLRPTRVNGSMNLGTEVITYGSEVTAGQAVSFPTIVSGGVKMLSSTPTMLRSPDVINGVFSLESLTINGNTKTGLSFPNLHVNPGKKYNLNLSFQVPCTEEVNSAPIDIRNGNEKTIEAPAADYGFTLDIFTLDNSFNMVINGIQLSSQEIQFQSNAPNSPRTMRFEDGAVWGSGGVPQIWDLKGTSTAPILRLVISDAGTVSMYGSKSNGGRLFPLVNLENMTFNNITWNKTGTNTVRVTQRVQQDTHLTGRGHGTRIISCPN